MDKTITLDLLSQIPKKRNNTIIFIIMLSFLTGFFPLPACDKSPSTSWLVYYGDNLPEENLKKVDLAILEPDWISPKNYQNRQTLFIGYLSVGEIHNQRSYWPEISQKEFVVEQNPDWEGAWRVDIRSREWQDLLLNRLIPEILKKGYQGVFLDTIDTAIYLEEKEPSKYSGSKKALVQFIKTIHQKFPDIVILPNNGLEILDDVGEVIGGLVVEDLYTRYDFVKKLSLITPQEVTKTKEQYIDLFKIKYKKPVYNILYDTSSKTSLAKYGIKRSNSKGYLWYVAPIDLMSLGTTMP